MKKITFLVLAMLCLYNVNGQQWVAYQFENHYCAALTTYNIVFSNDEMMYIHSQDIDRNLYLLTSSDHGQTWQKKVYPPNIVGPLKPYCWGTNSLEADASGNLYLIFKYHPCYDFNRLDYAVYKSGDKGKTWNNLTSCVTPSLLKYDVQTGNNTLAKKDEFWFAQPFDVKTSFVLGKSSYLSLGFPFLYTTSDGGNSWNIKPIKVNDQDLLIRRILGFKFFDLNNGLVFLEKKYLITRDGGNTWSSHSYPANITDTVFSSADAKDMNNIYLSMGKRVYSFGIDGQAATILYENDDDQVIKVVYHNNAFHFLTLNGYYVTNANTSSDVVAMGMDRYSTYPNPASSTITVASNDKSSLRGDVVKIYNIKGKLLIQIACEGDNSTINIEKFEPGIYYTEIDDPSGQKIALLKWIKQ